MADKYLLALDIGTSSLHAMVTGPSGKPAAEASQATPASVPQGGPPLARELDPADLMERLGRLVGQVIRDAMVNPAEVAAVGITSQRQGVAFLDSKGKDLYLGPNTDLRAALEGAAIDEEMGEEVYSVTGHLPSLMYAPARARWLREQRPQVHARIAHLLTIAGWLAYRLTGELADEPSLAGEAGLLDVNWRKHCLALLEKLGVSRGWLPPLVRAGTPIGTLHPSLAQIWGLEEGIPVTLAGPDTQCGLLSMQGVEEGEVGILAGWSCAVQMVTSRPCLDKERRTWVGCSPIEGLWVAESNLGDAGRAYRWLVETVADSHRPFEEVERLAQGTSPGAEGSLAFLGPGPVSMAKAGLRTGGLLFTTPISFQEVSKGQLFRAALENLAYSVKANLRILEEVTGLAPTGIHLGGGMSRSQTFARVLADVLGREVWVSPFPQVSAHGAAMAAAVSAGFYPDLKAASQAMALEQRKVEPQPVNVVEYQEHYQRWLAMYQRLQE